MVRTDARTHRPLARGIAFVLLGTLAACSSSSSDDDTRSAVSESNPACSNGVRDGDELGIDCGGPCVAQCAPDGTALPPGAPGVIGGVKDGSETDVDCGGASGKKCAEGKDCLVDADCEGACSYAKKCVSAPSCAVHFGGDTCGAGEVGEAGAQHESCCRSLPVPGFVDGAHPGKTVYLDKYEITAGRVRAWIEKMAAESGGVPNVKAWIASHRPEIWDPAWDAFLPSSDEGDVVVINRRLLGDPRVEDGTGSPGPGVILPPDTDQPRRMGTNYQFGAEFYVDLHGMNCGVHAGTYGFPTYWYPDDVLARDGQFPRAAGTTRGGEPIAAKDLLDVKSMNCITNAMLAAFCAWDGGQLATDEVLDYVTATPATLGNVSGCGSQYDDHGELLGNKFDNTVQTGGRCADVAVINATFDAGDNLPVKGSPLNAHNYDYPITGKPNHDKSWQISAPGRGSTAVVANGLPVDLIRVNPNDEPWADLHGNLNEAALDTSNGAFTGVFALKMRGIGYGSSRSDLNVTQMRGETVLRIQRPEAKAAYTGGRCMRFR